MRVAVDTSVLVALFVPDDTWHSQAMSLVSDLRQNQASVIYFDCVVAEALSDCGASLARATPGRADSGCPSTIPH